MKIKWFEAEPFRIKLRFRFSKFYFFGFSFGSVSKNNNRPYGITDSVRVRFDALLISVPYRIVLPYLFKRIDLPKFMAL